MTAHPIESTGYTVKGSLTPTRPVRPGRGKRREPVENDAYTAFLARAIRAAGRRVATGDVEGLADLLALREDVDKAAGVALKGLRDAGYSWDEIATRLGVTRQAVHQRWGHTLAQPSGRAGGTA